MEEKNTEKIAAEMQAENLPVCEAGKAKRLYSRHYKKAFILPFVLIVLSLLRLEFSFTALSLEATRFFQGIFIGMLVLLVTIHIKTAKEWKTIFSFQALSKSEIKVFDGYFTLTSKREETVIADYRFLFSEIRNVTVSGDLMSVTVRDQIFFLDKMLIPENSELKKALYAVRKANRPFKPKDKKSILLLLPALITVLLSVAAAVFCVVSPESGILSTPPVLFIVCLLPFVPIVLQLIFRKNRFVCLFNGLAALLCALVILNFVLNKGETDLKPTSYDASFIMQTEEELRIDFPETDDFYSFDNTENPGGFEDGATLRYAALEYADGLPDSFVPDERFLDRIPTALSGLLRIYYDGCSVCLYNKDTGEYNTIPEKEGRYLFVCVTVDKEYGEITLSEYYADVVK